VTGDEDERAKIKDTGQRRGYVLDSTLITIVSVLHVY